jgi:hypothetical protein
MKRFEILTIAIALMLLGASELRASAMEEVCANAVKRWDVPVEERPDGVGVFYDILDSDIWWLLEYSCSEKKLRAIFYRGDSDERLTDDQFAIAYNKEKSVVRFTLSYVVAA